MNKTAAERQEARDKLLTYLQPGDDVYVVNRHTSASGMTRFLELFKIEDGTPHRLTYLAAKALGWTYSDKYEAIKVEGAGMDMGFHTVYSLAQTIFYSDQFADTVIDGDDISRRGYWLNCRWL